MLAAGLAFWLVFRPLAARRVAFLGFLAECVVVEAFCRVGLFFVLPTRASIVAAAVAAATVAVFAVITAATARGASVCNVELLLLPLPESDCVNVSVDVVVFERRGEGGCWSGCGRRAIWERILMLLEG